MRFDYYLFDFDGTIADTGEGIRNSVADSLRRLGRPVPGRAILDRFVGPPLHDSYIEHCGMTEAEADEAIRLYRERYVEKGIHEAALYPGMAGLLRALHQSGCYVAIASAKPQFMLDRIMGWLGIDVYLDKVVGTGLERHSPDKRDLILRALPEGADLSRVCMTGDRRFDIEAAKALGICAVGADFGYALPGELSGAGADAVFDCAGDMFAWMLEGATPRGLFITLEGSDGGGKSTQIALLRDDLTRRGYETVVSREPGGCPISERIREVILSLDSRGMTAECEALLYAAARVEHVREVIEPALKCGKIVICDRFLDSSLAYQAYGRELGEAFIRQINEPAARLALPDVTLLLEVDRDSAKKRMAQGAPLDRLELEREEFFQRVSRGYRALWQAEPDRIRRIAASKSIEDVFAAIRSVVDEALLGRRTPPANEADDP